MSRLSTLSPLLMSGLLLTVGACATKPTPQETELMDLARVKEIAPSTAEEREEIKNHDALTQAAFWGAEYEKSPADLTSAVEFARVLRIIGSEERAIDVASTALSMHPGHPELLSILGKAQLSSGNPGAAVATLREANVVAPHDLSVLGALGVAYDQTGRHTAAQATYKKAIELDPTRASVHSNLGLSYALTGEPELGEYHLRIATQRPEAGARERQNLAMVLALQGKFDEAKAIGGTDLPDTKVEENLAYFRAMLTPQRQWSGLRGSLE